jgi:hypothetical protein
LPGVPGQPLVYALTDGVHPFVKPAALVAISNEGRF